MKAIKRFILQNLIISIIGGGAIVFLIYYIFQKNRLIAFGDDALNSSIYDLSIGYIGSMIFYILQVYIPEEKSRKMSLEILQPTIHKLINKMSFMIGFYDMVSDYYQSENKDIDYSNLYFAKIINKNGDSSMWIENTNVTNELKKYKRTINDLVNEIKLKSVYCDCDDRFKYLITELEDNKFINYIMEIGHCLNSIVRGDSKFDLLDEYIELRNEIQKFDPIVEEIEIIKLSKELEEGTKKFIEINRDKCIQILNNLDK